jgi:hypothetical protein
MFSVSSPALAPSDHFRNRLISKSKYLAGRQCSKLLWHHYNAKELIPVAGPSLQAIFDQGHQVGELVKQLYPNGIEIGDGVLDLEDTVRRTGMRLGERRPMFEASFAHNGGYCRVDILKPVDAGAWDIIEVKSTTHAKDIHLADLAFQQWVLTGEGLDIRRCILCHINSNYVRRGEVDPLDYFVMEDVTAQVWVRCGEVAGHVEDMFQTIGQSASPEIQIGPQCSDPYACPLQDHCWGFLPEPSVMDLYRGGKRGFELLAQGIQKIEDIPGDFKLTDKQSIQKAVQQTGEPHVDQAALAQFLAGVQYPLHFLDFETIAPAIPLFDGTRPYQQVPFQFSCHVVDSQGAQPEHRQFLAEGRGDPRPAFIGALREAIGSLGSIVVFNAGFEKSRLRECGEAMPGMAPWLTALESRFVDLLVPFRSFHYYHADQAGSASMKAVLPALTGRGYEDLAIQQGDAASRAFLRITFEDVSERERREVRHQLKDYCAQDTEGMIWMLEALTALAGSGGS